MFGIDSAYQRSVSQSRELLEKPSHSNCTRSSVPGWADASEASQESPQTISQSLLESDRALENAQLDDSGFMMIPHRKPSGYGKWSSWPTPLDQHGPIEHVSTRWNVPFACIQPNRISDHNASLGKP